MTVDWSGRPDSGSPSSPQGDCFSNPPCIQPLCLYSQGQLAGEIGNLICGASAAQPGVVHRACAFLMQRAHAKKKMQISDMDAGHVYTGQQINSLYFRLSLFCEFVMWVRELKKTLSLFR